MFKLILKQIRNQYRQNSWIFIELLLVSSFVWMMIDPVFVRLGNMRIGHGFEAESLYEVPFNMHVQIIPYYNLEEEKDAENKRNFWHVADRLGDLPEVASYTVCGTIPYGRSTMYFTCESVVGGDTLSNSYQVYQVSSEHRSDFFTTFDIRDAYTGEVVDQSAHKGTAVYYVTKDVADYMFPNGDAVGNTFVSGDGVTKRIAGVINLMKQTRDAPPRGVVIEVAPNMSTYYCPLLFRLKPGVDSRAFEARFQKEIAPTVNFGNYYCGELESYAQRIVNAEERRGLYNLFRMRFSLLLFALVCLFLGIFATFWMRVKERQAEIGLMRAMGASGAQINRQYLLESWMLYTAAFVLAILVQAHRIYMYGYEEEYDMNTVTDYLHLIPWSRFLLVSGITYLLLLVVVLISTYIPVNKTAKALPADTLRE